jgi:hypothetical protein
MPHITSLYGQDPDREWARLDQDPFQRLEYDPTLRFLTPVLSPAARVPDGLEAHLALAIHPAIVATSGHILMIACKGQADG